MKNKFTVRVYGVVINEKQELLVSDEKYGPNFFTKLPGGGLEFGEGSKETLKREFREELDARILSLEHLYTTDFFVPSAFDPSIQVISIYYRVVLASNEHIKATQDKFDFDHNLQKAESFRWVKLSELAVGDFTFPIDQHVFKSFLDEE